ncbi:MAG: site-specific DNA-methyltransferase [Holophagaceae bacterium]|nr:site-specific DNA-methyltransferase [Holophagaceae bacterium]
MPILNWLGKEKVINHHHDVPFHILEHRYTYGAKDTGNKIIHGDNLLALKSLLPEYEGRVKCIYIDPPYNTGNEGWVYNDNVNDPKIKKWLGEVVGREGEDLSRHDKWLCMMYPRLRLLQRLLTDDGAIFISIDDNEQANLRLICDEIFGGVNFVANIVWKKKTNGNNMGHIPPVHDFILVYAKNAERLALPGVPQSNEYINAKYGNPDDHPLGPWTTMDMSANHKGPYFEIENPTTGEKYLPPKGRYWVFNAEEVEARINDGRIIFGKSGNSRPVQRVFLKDRITTKKPETWFDTQGYNSSGMITLANILGGKVLDHPKPPSLLNYIITFATNKNDLILDSFAGSGTTAHAVLNMNKADGGNRKFILVEMEDYAETITAERVRRVIDGYADVEGTGGGFDYYELGDPLMLNDGNLNEDVPAEKICEYIWYTETRSEYVPQEEAYLLGTRSDTAYYFYYEKDMATVLGHKFLQSIKSKASGYIIYADMTTLGEDELEKMNIRFKKIPRDITRF